MKAYWQARGYAYKLDNNNYRDIVHDAYIAWHKKTGRNLFDEHRGVITTTVKNVFMSRRHTRRFMWRGNIYSKIFFPVQEDPHSYEVHSQLEGSSEGSYWPSVQATQLSDIIFDEMKEGVETRLTPMQRSVYNGLTLGYNSTEIAAQMKVSRQVVGAKMKHIKEKTHETIL